jgi:hypothetical protein
MKNKKMYLAVLCFIVVMAVPFIAHAFDAIRCGESSSYTFYGWFRNNTGMFMQSQDYASNGNQLATERTWMRAYGDFKFNPQWRLWVATQLVHEPWYTSEAGNPVSENGGPQQHHKAGWKTYSEFDDINDVLREVYVEWKPNNKNSIKMGRQIAIWGEALTDRVGDVIHPNDNRFAFAFANLEDTRIPQYMIRGLHFFNALNSSLEWIVLPPLVEGQYYVNRNGDQAFPSTGKFVEQRFAPYPEDRTTPGLSSYDPTVPSSPIFIPAGAVKEIYPDDWPGMRYGFRTATQTAGSQFGFSYFHTHNYDPLTSIGATRMVLPAAAIGIPVPGLAVPLGDYTLIHPYTDILGFYANKQLTAVPGVLRTEVVYSPNKPYNTFNVGTAAAITPVGFAAVPYEDGIVRRDWVKYMVAWDLNSLFYFSWHNTAPFNVTIEHIGEWVPNSRDLQYGPWNTKIPNYSANFACNISTDWFYSIFNTGVIFAYNTFGNSGLFMPSITWKPGLWNQRFTAELKYIGLYGDSNYEGLGIFRKKDMVVLTTQFNF